MVKLAVVTVQAHKELAPPVGVVESLSRGFETTNARLWLILLPLLLDLFLWIGPRLSVEGLTQQWVNFLTSTLATESGFQQNAGVLLDQLTAFGRQFNLFSILSAVPFGLPSLMAGRSPLATPFGPNVAVPVTNELLYILVFISFSLSGLLLGAIYFGLIASQLRESRPGLVLWLRHVFGNWGRFLVMSLLLALAGLILGASLILMMQFLGLFAPAAAQIMFVVAVTITLWVFVYVSFTPHGVVLGGQGVFAALWDSVRLVRWNLPATIGLFSLILALSWGLNLVWNLPRDDSWLLLLGVAGHAYVATGLVTASFVFYKDRHRWWREARALLIARLEQDRQRLGEG